MVFYIENTYEHTYIHVELSQTKLYNTNISLNIKTRRMVLLIYYRIKEPKNMIERYTVKVMSEIGEIIINKKTKIPLVDCAATALRRTRTG